MQDTWGNTITVADDGTNRTYTRDIDGTTVQMPSSDQSSDMNAINSFNGMQPG